MGLLSDLGNVFHAIGHFVTGSDGNANAGTVYDNQQDKRQQQQSSAPQQSVAPQQTWSPQSSGSDNNPANGNMINLSPLEKTPSPSSNLSIYNPTPAQPNSLMKAPQPDQPPTPPQPTPQHASIWHDLTHNDVTNVAGDIGKAVASPFVYLGKADIVNPTRELAAEFSGNQQAAANANRAANENLGLGADGTNFKGGLEKWAGNSAGALLTVAAPGIDNAVADGTSKLIPEAAPAIVKSQLPKFVAGGTVGGGFADANDVANGDTNPADLAKSFGEGFGLGGTAGVVLPAVASGLRKVMPFGSNAADASAADTATADTQPGQMAPGIRGANPDLYQPPAPVDNEPAYLRAPARAAAADQAQADRLALEKATVPDTPSDMVPSYQHQANIQSVIEDGNQRLNNWFNDNPGASPAEIDQVRQSIGQDVTDKVNQLNASRMPGIGEIAKDVVTNPADLGAGTVGAELVREAVDNAEKPAVSSATAAPGTAATDANLPVVEFNDTPPAEETTPPASTPTDTTGEPTASSTSTPTPVQHFPANGVTLMSDGSVVDANGNVVGHAPNGEGATSGEATAKGPATTVQNPQTAVADQQPVQVSQPTNPATVNTEANTNAPTQAELQQAAVDQQTSETPAQLLQDEQRRQAENAPNLRSILAKQIEGFDNRFGRNATTHDVFTNKELTQAAEEWANASSDQQLAADYANQPKLQSASDMAKANVTLHRLTALPESEATNKAIDNIVNALEEHSSNAGRQMNYLQEIYGNLPTKAKVPILIRQIDKARAAAGLPLTKDNLPLQNEIQAHLNRILSEGDDLAAARNNLLENMQQHMDNITKGQQIDSATAKQLVQEANDAKSAIKGYDNQLQAKQGELARYVKSVQGTPKNGLMGKLSGGAKNVAELQKSLLLTSIAGPLNDSTLSLMNGTRELTNMTASALGGKLLNKVTGTPGKFISKVPSLRTVAQGNNLAKTVGEMRGNLYSTDALDTLTKKAGDGRSGLLTKADNSLLTKFNARVHATREAATNLTAGIKDAKVQQLADQEGRQAGLKGDALKAYTALRTANPTRNMTAAGARLTEEVNNMNDNPLSRALGSKGGGLGKIPVIGPLIQNLFQPFSQWVGSQAWNGITDQNVAANLAKTIAAGARGDGQGVVDNLSKLGVNTAAGIGGGYALAKAGILTTQKGDSNSANDGLYLHFPGSNNYIPVTFTGGMAPSLIMGYAAYTGMNNPKSGSPSQDIADTAGSIFANTARAYAGGTPLAGNNSLIGPYGLVTQASNALNSKGGTTGVDVASNLGTQEASMFVPGAASDVNSVLNHSSLNPSGDAAQTTVKSVDAKGNLATNQPASNARFLESEIPVLSQTLPRNTAKAAPNFLSRYTRGSNTGASQIAAANLQKTTQDTVQQEIKDNVPVYQPPKGTAPKGYSFDNTLNTDVQTNAFDKAIQGLQSELKVMNTPGPAHIPPSTKQDVQDKITQLQVAQKNKLSYSDMELYNNTSVSAWRAMGNPDKDAYDPATYQKLWNIDQELAKAGVAGNFKVTAKNTDTSKLSGKQKYSLAASGSGRGGSSKAATLVKDNKIGSVSPIPNEDFTTNLTAKAISARIPQIALTKPDSLIKAHKITVTSPHP